MKGKRSNDTCGRSIHAVVGMGIVVIPWYMDKVGGSLGSSRESRRIILYPTFGIGFRPEVNARLSLSQELSGSITNLPRPDVIFHFPR